MPRWRIGALKQDASETPFERFSKERGDLLSYMSHTREL